MCKKLYPYKALVLVMAYLVLSLNLYSHEIITYQITVNQIDTIKISEISESRYLVSLYLKQQYLKELTNFTESNIGKKIQIVLLNKVLSTSSIEQSIVIEEFKIEELSTKKEAFDLMKMILMNEHNE